jgi:integral membrane protein (TIGR00529 family)
MMALLTASIPFLKVVAAFALMLGGMRMKIGLAPSILLGGVFMGLVFGMAPLTIMTTGLLALSREKFLLLAAIVGLIMVLSDGLERSGQSRRLMDALSGYLTGPRLRLVFFPALIGLLPMPGGAIFSAPMVKTMGKNMDLPPEDQALINYWFRHVWETAWPLYPGIILTVALAEIPIGTFISKTWPGVAAMFGLGWIFYLRRLRPEAGARTAGSGTRSAPGVVVREGLPLFIAIVGAVGCETLLARLAPAVPFEWGVIAALLAAVAALMLANRLGRAFVGQVLGKPSLWQMMLVVAAVFVFKDIMQAAGIVEQMAIAAGGGVALFAAAVFLPFLVGMVAGINVAFVGATFPLLLGLLHSMGLDHQILPYLVLATFAGFTGVMISPIHICFVLTCNYFGTSIGRAWRRVVAPCCCFLAVGAVYFFLLLALGASQ